MLIPLMAPGRNPSDARRAPSSGADSGSNAALHLPGAAEPAFAPAATASARPAQTFEYIRLERAFDASRSTGTTLGGGRVGKSTVKNAKNRDATDTMLLDLGGAR